MHELAMVLDHVTLSVEDLAAAKHAAFVIDPEGHNIEAVCFEDE